jgi:hypothetical protein
MRHLDRQSNQVQRINRKIDDIQNDPGIASLLKMIGPIPPKYAPKREEIDALVGANGIDDVSETAKSLWSRYAKRYNGIETASDLFRAGFNYALKNIFHLADKGGMVKLNRSLGTPTSKGAQVVYRALAYEWIKGGKPIQTCRHYEFHLNNKGVKMVSTKPEYVWKPQEVNGAQKGSLVLHFQDRDDFTPAEDELANTTAMHGIDPIAAKCLLAKLSSETANHLFIWLLEPALEDDHVDYQKSLTFITNQPKKIQEWVYLLRALICDMGVVLETKFNGLAMKEWQKYLDVDNDELQPFEKQQKNEGQVVPHSVEVLERYQLIPWQIHFEILSVMHNGIAQQNEFLDLIMNVQEKYQVYFKYLTPKLLDYPKKEGTIIKNLTWKQLNDQYHRVHQIIGGQGCLFSNLLTVFMTDPNDLTQVNIFKLKKAMAAYLDDPEHAKQFEAALRNDYHCSVKKYQQWLRQENGSIYLIKSHLTPVQIEIAAYALGVRIALFTPPSTTNDHACTKCEVDEYGRIVPVKDIVGHYFGPPTQEVFFMAVKNNHTYYALFPKLNGQVQNLKKLGMNSKEIKTIQDIDKYWQKLSSRR